MKDQLTTLLEPYDDEIKNFIRQILAEEQKMISYNMQPGSLRLDDIKSKIKHEIEQISNTGYEA